MRRAIYTVAGPTASLLLAIGLFLLFLHLPSSRQDACWQLVATAAISLLFFLGSAIPHTLIGEKTDGAWLVGLWRHRADWKEYYANRDEWNALMDVSIAGDVRHQALMKLFTAAESGKRPRDWDSAALTRAVSLQDGKSNEAIAAHYAFYWAEDREDPEASGKYIARALAVQSSVSACFQAKVLLDAAYHAGFRQGDATAARTLLVKAVPVTATDDENWTLLRSMTLRSEAAALLAEGKAEEALSKAQESLSSLSLVEGNVCTVQCLTDRLIGACSEAVAKSTI